MLDIKGLLFKSLKRHTEGHIELSDYKYTQSVIKAESTCSLTAQMKYIISLAATVAEFSWILSHDQSVRLNFGRQIMPEKACLLPGTCI